MEKLERKGGMGSSGCGDSRGFRARCRALKEPHTDWPAVTCPLGLQGIRFALSRWLSWGNQGSQPLVSEKLVCQPRIHVTCYM